MIISQLSAGPRSLDDLRDFALTETVYRPQQVWGVVRDRLARGVLERIDGGGHLRGGSRLQLSSTSPQPVQDALFRP